MIKSEKFWDRISATFARQPIKDEQAFLKKIDNIQKHLGGGEVVLDYACGTGTISIAIADAVKEIHAIDISSKMLDIAKTRTIERGIENIHYRKATLFDKQYEKESFDVILACNILHFIDDTQMVLQRINELITPGGLFISETPCMGEKKSFLNIFMSLLSKTGLVPELKFLERSELESAISREGFQVIETQSRSTTPPELFIVAKKKISE